MTACRFLTPRFLTFGGATAFTIHVDKGDNGAVLNRLRTNMLRNSLNLIISLEYPALSQKTQVLISGWQIGRRHIHPQLECMQMMSTKTSMAI